MIFNKKINLSTLNQEEKILVSRAKEMADKADYSIVISDFLTPREQIIFYQSFMSTHSNAACYFWGGAIGCERRCAILLPEWLLNDAPNSASLFDEKNERFIISLIENGLDNEEIKNSINTVNLQGSTYATLTHRDWLGSILGLGIKRYVIGDIAVYSDSNAKVFVKDKMVDFVCDSFTHCKNDTVKATKDSNGCLEMPRTFKHYETIVQSLRLDCIVKSLTNLSRSEAGDLVKAGNVDVNYFTETDCDTDINEEDILSIHGFGKFVIDGIEGHTKSGKIKLKSRKYI